MITLRIIDGIVVSKHFEPSSRKVFLYIEMETYTILSRPGSYEVRFGYRLWV